MENCHTNLKGGEICKLLKKNEIKILNVFLVLFPYNISVFSRKTGPALL